MTPPLVLICLLCGVVAAIMYWLRHTKGRVPLRAGEDMILPATPGVRGVVMRLDGLDRKNREIYESRYVKSRPDGSLSLPYEKWNQEEMTVARLASIAHVWAMAQLAKDDPDGYKDRESSVARARVVPILGLFVCMIMMVAGRMTLPIGFTLLFVIWTMMVLVSIPSQFREWKAVAIAKTGLKQAGLYPQFQNTAAVLDRCIAALSWCRVAGFRQIVPR